MMRTRTSASIPTLPLRSRSRKSKAHRLPRLRVRYHKSHLPYLRDLRYLRFSRLFGKDLGKFRRVGKLE